MVGRRKILKRSLWLVLVSLVVLVLAACGGETTDNAEKADDEIPQPLEVQLEVQETADVDETVPLKATVTLGDEKITDADEVEFEVWEEGKKEDSEMIEAKNNKDGTYEAETSFDHDGVFTVQVHVTARGQHTMPKQNVTVGEGALQGHDHEEADHAEGFSMHLMKPENVKSGEETELVVHVEFEDEALEDVRVRYEIWNEEVSEAHDWVDAKESVAGEYVANYTFEEAGTYQVHIHVEDDEDLHEHEEHKIEVK